MNFVRKTIAIIITCLLFTFLVFASIAASAVIIVLGIIALVYVRYKKPTIFGAQYTQTRRADIIEGEYRVIETIKEIEKKEG